jgi:hypothetical protein
VALTMLLGTVQMVSRLHRTTLVAAMADDAVHRVAEAGSEADTARAEAEHRLRRLLGPEAHIQWSTTTEGPTIEIAVPSPSLPGLSAGIRRGAGARGERRR